jgi:hypothetical protein
LACIAIAAIAGWLVAGPGPSTSKIAAQFDLTPLPQAALNPEPKENAAFLSGMLFGAIALWGCAIGSRSRHLPREIVGGLVAMGFAAVALVMYRLDWTTGLPPLTSDLLIFAAAQPWVFYGLALLFGLMLFLVSEQSQVKLCVLAGLASAIYLVSLVFVTYHDPIIQSVHFEVFYYPIVQSYLGVPIGVEQPSQYGLYPILLSPLWCTDADSVRRLRCHGDVIPFDNRRFRRIPSTVFL